MKSADHSVASRGRVVKFAIFVSQGHSHAVDLGFDYHRDFFIRQEAGNAAIECGDVLFRIGIIEAQHRRPVTDLREGFQRSAANALSGGIRRGEIRIARLDVCQLLVEAVIIPIANRRCRVLVIPAVVFEDFSSQLRDSFLGVRGVFLHPARPYEPREHRQSRVTVIPKQRRR
jgi:hypothetical protein